uniref:Uncharacterized protein n=1 Tax=Fusarium oxysporum (strain Fo5176) TaxID=660025 RepID=A0A0D2XFJ6_FUSOF
MDESLLGHWLQTALVKVEPVMLCRDVLWRKDSLQELTQITISSAGASKDMRKAAIQESLLDVFEVMAKLLKREPQFLVAIQAHHAFNRFFTFWFLARHKLLDTPQDWIDINPFWIARTFFNNQQAFPAHRRDEAPRLDPNICAFVIGKRELKKAGLLQKKTLVVLTAEKDDL